MKLKPLVSRIYRYKSPSLNFYCPLCRTPRELLHSRHLKQRHFVQIIILDLCVSAMIMPRIEWRFGALLVLNFFVFWCLFELVRKTLFRKEIPCPHCGFDATWYKRDVRVAKKMVQEFWQKKSPPKEKN